MLVIKKLNFLYIAITLCNVSSDYSIPMPSTSILETCVSRVIENFYGNDTTLYYVFIDNVYDDLPYNTSNPKVIVEVNEPIVDMEKRRGKNFVINWHYFRKPHIVDILEKTVLFHDIREVFNSRHIVVIKDQKAIRDAYQLLWSWGMIYSVMIFYRGIHREPVVFTTDPHARGNGCRYMPENVKVHQCITGNFDLKSEIPHPLRNYNKCPIAFNGSIFDPKTDRMSACVIETIHTLTSVINATMLLHVPRRCHDVVNLHYKTQHTSSTNLFSEVFLKSKLVWVVPQPNRIVGVKVFLKVFTWGTWLLIVSGFVALTAAWALILHRKSRYEDLAGIIFNIFSMTVLGVLNSSMPKLPMLRFIILIYILCYINMQTALVCKLIPVLTIPMYEKGIDTLEELLDSGYPIYTTRDIKNVYFFRDESNDTLYSRMKQNLQVRSNYSNGDLRELMLYNNISVLLPAYTLETWQSKHSYTFTNTITDSMIVEDIEIAFYSVYNNYIMDTVNVIITRLIEAGVYQKRENDVAEYHQRLSKLRKPSGKPVALSLSHVYGIFIIYGFCIVASTIVFIIELAVKRYSS